MECRCVRCQGEDHESRGESCFAPLLVWKPVNDALKATGYVRKRLVRSIAS
jgi:hypothetical protein